MKHLCARSFASSLLTFPLTLTSFLLTLQPPSSFPASSPQHPSPFVLCVCFFFFLAKTCLPPPTPPPPPSLFLLCLLSIMPDINSRLLSGRQVWIGPELRICPPSQPIERSVIMVIGHSLILEPLSLFQTSFITLEKLSLQRATPHSGSLLLRG